MSRDQNPDNRFSAICTLANQVYDTIWTDWYLGILAARKAKVEILPSDDSAGYSHAQNRIIIPVPAGNFDDLDILDPGGWPVWKIDLIHEMLRKRLV
jgi:hypothetical protein